MRVDLPKYTCLRCGHAWHPRKEERPVCCARCKSPYWDRAGGAAPKLAGPRKGGVNRAAALSPERRLEISRLANEAKKRRKGGAG